MDANGTIPDTTVLYQKAIDDWIHMSIDDFEKGNKSFAKESLQHMIEHLKYNNNKRILLDRISQIVKERELKLQNYTRFAHQTLNAINGLHSNMPQPSQQQTLAAMLEDLDMQVSTLKCMLF